MEQYADYEFYRNQYGGTEVTDEKTYARYCVRASSILDTITRNRCRAMDEIPDSVKYALCSAVDVYAVSDRKTRQTSGYGSGLKSASTDGESRSFTDDYANGTAGKLADREAVREMESWLENTDLLLRRRGTYAYESGNDDL